jgi:hypothetical protein
MTAGSDFPGPGSRTWHPRRGLIALGFGAALAAAMWVVLTNSPMDLVVGVVITIVLVVLSVAGWRRRLVGGPRGLLICGSRGTRIVPWSEVRTIDSATSSRFGLATTTIEVDLINDDLLVFGRTELGADPGDVLAALREWAPQR